MPELINWLKKGATHYSPVAGIPELRPSIASELSSRHSNALDPATVIVTPGAKMMILSMILAVVDAGDEVIYPAPAYPAYEAAIRIAGATPVAVRLEESKGFRFDLDEVARRITPRTSMFVTNSPQNQTDGVLQLGDLQGLFRLAEEHDLLILSAPGLDTPGVAGYADWLMRETNVWLARATRAETVVFFPRSADRYRPGEHGVF